MGTESGDGHGPGTTPEAFVAAMRQRLEEDRAPAAVAAARSWWVGFRRFLVIGAMAIALAVGLALLAEHRYAAPLCERYAADHGQQYRGLDYPYLGRSSSTSSSSGRCIFADPAGRRTTVSLRKLEPDFAADFAVSAALQLEFTIPAFFVLVALAAAAILRRRP